MGTPALATELALSPTNAFAPVNHVLLHILDLARSSLPAPSISFACHRASQYVCIPSTLSVRDRREERWAHQPSPLSSRSVPPC
eukprot:3719915-Rhodomonas_salina.1